MSQDFLDDAFDPETEECSKPFPLIPQGQYEAQIVKADYGPTKNGKGCSVVLNWSIAAGEDEHRTIFQHLMLQHENPDAQRIGRQQFADVLAALGIKEKVTNLDVLYNKPCMIGVKVVKDKHGQYDDQNKVGRVAAMKAPSPHNGATRTDVKAALAEAQKVQPAFKAVKAPFNDDIPFAPEFR
jgi:hypothetical protein